MHRDLPAGHGLQTWTWVITPFSNLKPNYSFGFEPLQDKKEGVGVWGKKKGRKSLKQPNQGKIASSCRVTVCRALPSLIVTIKQLLHTKTESVGKLSLLLNEMEKGETALDTRFFLAEGSNYIPIIKGFQAHK